MYSPLGLGSSHRFNFIFKKPGGKVVVKLDYHPNTAAIGYFVPLDDANLP